MTVTLYIFIYVSHLLPLSYVKIIKSCTCIFLDVLVPYVVTVAFVWSRRRVSASSTTPS